MEQILVIQQVAGLGCTHEQPGLTAERPTIGFTLPRFEHAADVGAHRSDARAGRQHDDVGVLAEDGPILGNSQCVLSRLSSSLGWRGWSRSRPAATT